MTAEVRLANDLDLAAAFKIRHAVFVIEQGVPEQEERDAWDDTAIHVVAVDPEHGIVGTCRLLSDDGTVARIGRMAVLAEFRRRGIAEAMLALAERHASDEGATSVILDAQLPARIFYERAGYVAHGPVFLDAGIEHVAMTKQLPPR